MILLTISLLASIQCGSSGTGEAPEAPAPPPSVGHALVFHDSLQAVLLVNAGLGGMTPPPVTAPTVLWRWNGTAWTIVDSMGPPVRNLAGVAYDPKRNVLVVYGGSYDLPHMYGETWEWHQNGGWQQRNVAGPGNRDHTDMAWDAGREKIVLFGGQIGIDSFPGDTWTWDGQSWEQVATTGPSGRVHHTMAYDPLAGQVLVFGGYAPATGDKGDTWSWSGSSWSVAAPAITPRTHARMGRTTQGMIILGGTPVQAPGSVLLLQNGSWQPANQPNAPSARYLTAIAFDPARNVTVLFGGGDPGSDQLYADTWEYSTGSGWRRVSG